MHGYFLAFVWGLCILCSLLGWGYGLLAAFRMDKKSDFGWQGALGLSFAALIGGVFNNLHAVSKGSIMVFLALGGALFIVSAVLNFKTWSTEFSGFKAKLLGRKGLVFLLLLLLVVLFVRYGSSVAFYPFHGTDDQNGYMAFPVKLIQTGSLGNDPFSERKITSSLGGEYYLQSFVLAGADIKNLHLIENGIGVIFFIFILWGLLKDRKLGLGVALWVLLGAALIPSPSGNLTSFFTSIVLFAALCRFLISAGKLAKNNWLNLIFLALLAAGLCTLKSNLIAPCVILFLSYFYLRRKSGLKLSKVLGEMLFSGALVFIFLASWMIAMKGSNGTWLYPYLGSGYWGSRYGDFLSPYLEFTVYGFVRLVSEFIFGLALFVPFFVLGFSWLKAAASREKNAALLIFLSAFIGWVAMVYGIGAYSLYYYSFAFVMPTVFVLLALVLEKGDLPFFRGSGVKAGVFGMLILLFIFGAYVQQDTELFSAAKDILNIDSGLKLGLMNSDLVPANELKQYSALQNSVPAGAPIIATLDRNFLFDFKRNPVYINDLPGGSSLPPGLPFKKGPEALANYLLASGIKYVTYSYGNEANFSRAIDGSMLRPHVNPVLRTQTEHSFDYHDNLVELAQTRKVIYDDGKNFVLDLSQKP